MLYFYSSPEPVQYKINHRTPGLQKFILPGENIIICLFPFSLNQGFIQLLFSQRKIPRSFRKANPGYFSMVTVDAAYSISLMRFSYRNLDFNLSFFIALELRAAFCYTVGNEKQLLKLNTKFCAKLKPHNWDKYVH